MIQQLVKYLVVVIAFIVIVRSFGIGLGLLLNGIAVLLVGIGVGLQDLFKDFASGLTLLFEGSTKVGDIIEIPNYNGEDKLIATVTEINIRTTKVETPDNNTIIIPNSVLTSQSVNNWSFGTPLTRFIIPISVEYNSNLDKIKSIMIDAAISHPKVKNTKPVFVRLKDFGNYGIDLELVFWVDQNFYINNYKSDIRFKIEKEFRANGIVIPFPQSDIYIKNIPQTPPNSQGEI